RRGGPGPTLAGRGRLQRGRQGSHGHAIRASEAARAGWPNGRCAPSRQQAAMLRMLVQLREYQGFNQTALGDRLRITQSEVSKFERGERTLDVLRLRAWLHALGIGLTPFADALEGELD